MRVAAKRLDVVKRLRFMVNSPPFQSIKPLDIFPPQGKMPNHKYVFVFVYYVHIIVTITIPTVTLNRLRYAQSVWKKKNKLSPAQKHIYVEMDKKKKEYSKREKQLFYIHRYSTRLISIMTLIFFFKVFSLKFTPQASYLFKRYH